MFAFTCILVLRHVDVNVKIRVGQNWPEFCSWTASKTKCLNSGSSLEEVYC